MEDSTRRAAFIADLRAFADWLEANPDIPAPNCALKGQYSPRMGGSAEEATEVARVCALLGIKPQESATNITADYTVPNTQATYVLHAFTALGDSTWDAAMAYRQNLVAGATS